MYVCGEYQFARRWFAGARYDWSERAYDASLIDKGPSLLAHVLAERVQPDPRAVPPHSTLPKASTSNEVLFQFLFSIGAHGAHVFYGG